MKYRKEIDGLRAVAILPVIFFHAGFKLFEGGFVGVDVFFVISGYLITTIILTDMNNGNFSILTFYERRARRIMPALFFVLLCCLPCAYMWLPPEHLEDFSQSLIAVSGFCSNVLFWLESGYFGIESELKPLLHTWSLAVEEQYYVLFPIFLLLLWKLRKRWLFSSLVVVASMSLAIAEYGRLNFPSANFFLLPGRIWELAIGALIAFLFTYHPELQKAIRQNTKISNTFSIVGLSMICYSTFTFNNSTPYPSFYTIIPTMGAGLIVIFATSKTMVGKLLSTKVMVGIGLISYSTYLWHQPLFVFARHRSLTPPSTTLLLILSAASILFAYISWRYVENPFRNKSRISRKTIFTFTLLGSIVFAGIGITGDINHGYTSRINYSNLTFNGFKEGNEIHLFKNYLGIHEKDNNDSSKFTNYDPNNLTIDTAIFGDSHVNRIAVALGESGHTFVVSGKGGCPPLHGIDVAAGNNKKGVCRNVSESQIQYINTHPEIKNVFLIARWSLYTSGDYESPMDGYFLDDGSGDYSQKKSRELFEIHLRKTLDYYYKKNINLYIFFQIPQQKEHPERLINYILLNNYPLKDIDPYTKTNIKDHLSLQEYNRDTIKKIANNYANTSIISLDDYFCNEEFCMMFKDNTILYDDHDHLSFLGAKKLNEYVSKQLKSRGF